MRTLTATRRIIVLAALLCLAPLPATAAGLYSTHAAFYTESSNGWFVAANGDGFGHAVATGDFNGDGADDLATGIPYDDNALGWYTNSGIVIVRYGVRGTGLASGPANAVLSQMNNGSPDPPEPGDHFGWALAAGDFDGDGYDDLAVGGYFDGPDNGGAVQIHYGAAGGLELTGSQHFHQDSPGMSGEAEGNDWFGSALAAGDFDGDSFADLAIGIPGEGTGLPTSQDTAGGRLVTLFGSAAGLSASGSQWFSQDHPDALPNYMDGTGETFDHFADSLAAGDVNGDGYDDLAVGVPGENDGGGVHVILGSASGLTSAGNNLWTQDDAGVPGADECCDDLGHSLAVADFNGDGYDDIAVGAPREDLELSDGAVLPDVGALHVFFGSPAGISGSNSGMWTASSVGLGSSESSDFWGHALAAGDFNADGYADLAVGAKGEGIGVLAATGEVTILLGHSGGVTSWGGQLWQQDTPGVPDANEGGDQFGFALAAGDFDGNGYADLAIGAPTESTGAYSGNGAEWVLYGYLFADGLESGTTSQWQVQSPTYRGTNNLGAATAAKLGTAASQYGLRVTLVDPSIAPSRQAYVMAGPARGFSNETTLTGTFFVDPQSLTMSTTPGANAFQMVTFTDGVGPGSKTRLIFYLGAGTGGYFISVWHWNDNLPPAGGLQLSGGGAVAGTGPTWRNNRVEFEWRAGNPGHLTMWRTRYVDGSPDASGRIQLFSADLPGMQNAVINHVYAGMVAGQSVGTFGALYLDELSFGR